jgi:hypothetical protein
MESIETFSHLLHGGKWVHHVTINLPDSQMYIYQPYLYSHLVRWIIDIQPTTPPFEWGHDLLLFQQ